MYTTYLMLSVEDLTTMIVPLCPASGAYCLFALTWSWLRLVNYYAWLVAYSQYYPYIVLLCIHAVMMTITVVVVFVDLILFITIIRSYVCVMVYVCVCAVYRLYEVSQFGWTVLQNVTGVCALLLAICFLKYCLTITGVCLTCFVLCMIILPVFIAETWVDHPQLSAVFPSMITPCIHRPLSSLWAPTVDPVEKCKILVSIIVLNVCFLPCF